MPRAYRLPPFAACGFRKRFHHKIALFCDKSPCRASALYPSLSESATSVFRLCSAKHNSKYFGVIVGNALQGGSGRGFARDNKCAQDCRPLHSFAGAQLHWLGIAYVVTGNAVLLPEAWWRWTAVFYHEVFRSIWCQVIFKPILSISSASSNTTIFADRFTAPRSIISIRRPE